MAIEPITAGIEFFTNIVNKIWPDKSEQEKQEIVQLMAREAQEQELLKGQQEINKVEAASENLFNSGWRPFIGWSCGWAFAWHFSIGPFFSYILSIFNIYPDLPHLNIAEVLEVLFGLLGLGYLRTRERLAGVIPRGK